MGRLLRAAGRVERAVRVLQGREDRGKVRSGSEHTLAEIAELVGTPYGYPKSGAGISRPRDAFRNVPIVHACIDRIVTGVAISADIKDRAGKTLHPDSAVVRALARPNAGMDWVQFSGMMAAQMALWGVCRVWKQDKRILWPLGPNDLKPQSKKKFPPDFYVYGNRVIPAEEVIEVKRPDPLDLFDPTSAVEATTTVWRHQHLARLHMLRSLENGAFIPGLIIYPGGMTDKQYRQFSDRWSAHHTGPDNSGAPAILEGSAIDGRVQVEKLGFSPVDLQMTDLVMESKETICGTMGVPPALVGIYKYANYANIGKQLFIFFEWGLRPYWRRIESALTTFWLETDWQRGLRLEFSKLDSFILQEARREKIETINAAIGTGLLLVNEGREEIGKEPTAYGWDYQRPFGLEPVPSGLRAPKPVRDIGSGPGALDFVPGTRKDDPEEDEVVNGRSRKLRAAMYRATDNLAVSLEKRYSKEFDKLFRKLRTELIDNATATWDSTHELSYDREAHDKASQDARYRLQKIVCIEGGKQGLSEAEPDRSIRDIRAFTLTEAMLAELLARSAYWTAKSGEFTFQMVGVMGTTALEEGWTLQELVDHLKASPHLGASTVGKVARAERIARTEVIGTLNYGKNEAYNQSPATKGREWLTSIDGRERPAHAAADGQVRAKGVPFDVDGEKLDYPGDWKASAKNIIQCRCSQIPTLVKPPDAPEEGE